MAPAHTCTGVKLALNLIESARLPHPLGPLLESFIHDAVGPQLAAEYVLYRGRSVENRERDVDLLGLVADWTYVVESLMKYGSPPAPIDAATQAAIVKRDGDRCCITGKTGRIWDPLVVVPVVNIPSRWILGQPRIATILDVFFTGSYRDWWFDLIERAENMSPYRNHWLVRKSAAHAFAQCFVKLERVPPSMVEFEVRDVLIGPLDPIGLEGSYPLLGDHSRLNVEKVEVHLVGAHARFAPSQRWIDMAKEIALNKSDRESRSLPAISSANPAADRQSTKRVWHFLAGLSMNACFAAWLMVPSRLRVLAYRMLRWVGRRFYGPPDDDEHVQKLPFGLCLKYSGDPEAFCNEFNALQIVRKYTSVRPDIPLSLCQDIMSDKDAADFVAEMQDFLTQMRAIPKTVSPGYDICNTLGGACRDQRIDEGHAVGPFVDEADFSQALGNPDEESRRGHQVVFTHADLRPQNILVGQVTRLDGTKGWKVTGIVDWESSGYFPEYWDYTKSLFEGFGHNKRWRDVAHDIFAIFGDFSKEAEVEKRSWEEAEDI